MKITLVGNAGIYMRDKKRTILIDSLYGGNKFFNQKPSEVSKAAVGKGHDFRNVDVLLFTHRHEDHFCSTYVNSYIRHNRVQHVFIPRVSRKELKYEDTGLVCAGDTKTTVSTIGMKDEVLFYEQIFTNSWVVFFKTKHMGEPEFDVPHYSIALLIDGNSYLFMGDTDWSYSVRNVRNIISGTTLKGIFMNPLSYADKKRKEWLAGLGYPQILLYHIPFADDDVAGLRQQIQGETGFYHLRDGYALKENRQTVFIN